MTNREKISSMDEKEMANWIVEVGFRRCPDQNRLYMCGDHPCAMCWEKWLGMEYIESCHK